MRIPQQAKLLEFVTEKHKDQVRKYIGEPYLVHLIAVAEMAEKTNVFFGWEIGLCHDLLEDTNCDRFELFDHLISIGYTAITANHIRVNVEQLTDKYTKEAFPSYNRSLRKQLEADRLYNTSPDAQTVKYCDLINNTQSIVEHDKGFARVYLAEKRYMLSGMTKGDPSMRSKCIDCLNDANQIMWEYESIK